MIIGIDIDEVLAEFLEAYCNFFNEKYGTKFTWENFHSYSFWKVAGGTREETTNDVHEFHKTKYFSKINPVEGSIEAINELKNGNTLYAVSSRQDHLLSDTTQWLEKHYPKMFDGIYLTNHLAKSQPKKTKKEICAILKVDVLIEDQPKFAVECALENRTVILFDKPWNKAFSAKNVTRAKNWNEIINLIKQKENNAIKV